MGSARDGSPASMQISGPACLTQAPGLPLRVAVQASFLLAHTDAQDITACNDHNGVRSLPSRTHPL